MRVRAGRPEADHGKDREDRRGQLESPVGLPDKAEISLRLSLPGAVLERLTARAVRAGRKLEALVQEIREGAAK